MCNPEVVSLKSASEKDLAPYAVSIGMYRSCYRDDIRDNSTMVEKWVALLSW
jgi:hypothetical protein